MHLTIRGNDAPVRFRKAVAQMYELFTEQPFPRIVRIAAGFEPLIELLYRRHGEEPPKISAYELQAVEGKEWSDAVLIGYSGGLDSSYLALKLHDDGDAVKLMHIAGLNRVSKKEDEFAKRFADAAGLEYIELWAQHTAKETFIDNPLKNQLIFSELLDYGIEHGIRRFGLGADWCTGIDECTVGMTLTDAIETNELFFAGVRKYFPEYEAVFIPADAKKRERLAYIAGKHPALLPHVFSCISPHRFNESLHIKNEQKYGVHLLAGRCGSCYKCAMEFLLLESVGYYARNKAYEEHCWKVLAESKTAHRKDLFSRKNSIERRWHNLLHYGS